MEASSRIPSRLKSSQLTGTKRVMNQKENMIPVESKKGRFETALASQKTITRAHSVLSLSTISNKPIPARIKKDAGRITNVPYGRKEDSKKPPTKPKRAAWDLKGRIQDMEEEFGQARKSNQQLHDQLELTNERIAFLEQVNLRLNEDVACKASQSEQASKTVENLESKLKEKERELESTCSKLKANIEQIKVEKSKLEEQLLKLTEDLSISQRESQNLKSTVVELTTAQIGISTQLETTKVLLQQEKENRKMAHEEIEDLQKLLQERDTQIINLETQIRDDETMRRKMHNTIQELKGNIRVFCRVRPLLSKEQDFTMEHIHFPDPDHHTIELTPINGVNLNESSIYGKIKPGSKFKFTFDKVFEPTATQNEVFDEVSQLIQSTLDGYNVCVFAYGQTGSGKTYTMEGPENISDFRLESENVLIGIIPRTIHQIFHSVQNLKEKGWKYQLEASFLEIYNETIKDLLTDHPSGKCEIKMTGGKNKDVYVTNISLIRVTTEECIQILLKKARKNRAVASTQCNEYSSRSHSVFRLKLNGHNEITSEDCEGMLNLVDLAGSERLKESCSEGNRLMEAKNINKSLSNLGNVIMALAQKADHIPYRNSKLTHLLMNCLGGNSKTLMFVNVSPSENHFGETINSLRFATKVNQCHIGTAQQQMK